MVVGCVDASLRGLFCLLPWGRVELGEGVYICVMRPLDFQLLVYSRRLGWILGGGSAIRAEESKWVGRHVLALRVMLDLATFARSEAQ